MKEKVSVDEERIDKIIYILDGKFETQDASAIRTLWFEYERLKRLHDNVKFRLALLKSERENLGHFHMVSNGIEDDIKLLESLYE